MIITMTNLDLQVKLLMLYFYNWNINQVNIR
jgi:hypothetical protein